MPLPPSDCPREPLHTRNVRVQSFAREDGLWDLEAELLDTKAYDFPTRDGGVFESGRPVHLMHLRVTIDSDFTILRAAAAYDAAPYGAECSAIEDAYQALVGMNLLKGFRHAVKARFARTAGCTHMSELTNVLPTTAVQTMANQRRLEKDTTTRPFQLDGCHALRTDGPAALKYYPRWYTGAGGSCNTPGSSTMPQDIHAGSRPAGHPAKHHSIRDSSIHSASSGRTSVDGSAVLQPGAPDAPRQEGHGGPDEFKRERTHGVADAAAVPQGASTAQASAMPESVPGHLVSHLSRPDR